MTNQTERTTAQSEQAIVKAMRSPSNTDDHIKAILIARLTEPFVMCKAWAGLVRDTALSSWRRLAACQVLIQRCVSYPCKLDDFASDVLTPLGFTLTIGVDMTMAEALPFARNDADEVRMVALPIQTDVGMAALYYAVQRATRTVIRAAIYPEAITL